MDQGTLLQQSGKTLDEIIVNMDIGKHTLLLNSSLLDFFNTVWVLIFHILLLLSLYLDTNTCLGKQYFWWESGFQFSEHLLQLNIVKLLVLNWRLNFYIESDGKLKSDDDDDDDDLNDCANEPMFRDTEGVYCLFHCKAYAIYVYEHSYDCGLSLHVL